MTWLQHHTKSEKLAADAEAAGRRGNVKRAQKLYSQAARAEALALADVEPGKSRTLGITAVSAVSLYCKATQFQTADALARRWLASEHLPTFAVEHLRALLRSVRSEQVRERANVGSARSKVLVSIGAPTEELVPTEEFLQQACEGDEEALGKLLALHLPELRRVVAGKLSTKWQSLFDEDDVVLETLTDAFLGIHQFTPGPGSAFLAWLTTLVTRNLHDSVRMLEADDRGGHVRRLTPGGSDESYAELMGELLDTATTPSDNAARDEAKAALNQAIAKLPNDYRRVIQMYDLEERPLAEVAEAMERSRGATSIMRHRAIRMLEEIMGTA